MFHTTRFTHFWTNIKSLILNFLYKTLPFSSVAKTFYQLKSKKWEIRVALPWPNCYYVTSQQKQKSDKHVKYYTLRDLLTSWEVIYVNSAQEKYFFRH